MVFTDPIKHKVFSKVSIDIVQGFIIEILALFSIGVKSSKVSISAFPFW